MTSLAELEATIRRRLALFEYPMRDWMVADASTDYDVVIVGAGKRALALALALQRERIHRVALIETHHADTLCMAAELAIGEGPARADFATHSFALPLLSFASWQRASGTADGAWSEYLLWYRRFVAVPVLTDIAVVNVAGAADHRLGKGGTAISTRRLVITIEADSPGAHIAAVDMPPGATLGFAHLPAEARAKIVATLRADDAAADIATSEYFELLDAAEKPLPVHLFGTRALASVGPAATAANLVRYGVPRVLAGLSRGIFLEDQDRLYRIFQDFETAEVLGGKLAPT